VVVLALEFASRNILHVIAGLPGRCRYSPPERSVGDKMEDLKRPIRSKEFPHREEIA
jgi:hypothetical protein